MGREYSNRRPASSRSSGPNQLLVIVVTFVLGYFTASFFDIEMLGDWLSNQVLAHHEPQKASSQSVAKEDALPPKPKFEFYTLLTNDKVPNSQTAAATANRPTQVATATNPAPAPVVKPQQLASVKTTETKALAPVAEASGRGNFSVQVASFKTRQDAEQMKGLLTLKGFNVAVVPINHAVRGVWYRVVVGPYANRVLAQKAQVDLARSEHLQGMVTAG